MDECDDHQLGNSAPYSHPDPPGMVCAEVLAVARSVEYLHINVECVRSWALTENGIKAVGQSAGGIDGGEQGIRRETV